MCDYRIEDKAGKCLIISVYSHYPAILVAPWKLHASVAVHLWETILIKLQSGSNLLNYVGRRLAKSLGYRIEVIA